MFYGMAVRLGINSRQLTVIDRKESFYYFALNQDNSLWLHDVVMFMQEKESIFFLFPKEGSSHNATGSIYR